MEEAVWDLCPPEETRSRLDPGSKPADRVLVAQWADMAARSDWTHKHESWLAEQTFDEAALVTTYTITRRQWPPVMPSSAQRRPISSRGSTGSVRRGGPPSGRLPGGDPHGRPGAAVGGVRLASLRACRVADGVRWSGPHRALQRCVDPPGHPTKAGNAHMRTQLVEGAWQYQHRPYVGSVTPRRHEGVDPETVAQAWAAQLRVCGRFRHLASRKNTKWAGDSRYSPRARRAPLGGDDRSKTDRSSSRRSSRLAGRVTETSTMRRRTAVAGPIPRGLCRDLAEAKLVRGNFLRIPDMR